MMGCRGLVGERGMCGFGWVSGLCARGLVGHISGQQAQAGFHVLGSLWTVVDSAAWWVDRSRWKLGLGQWPR